MEIKARDGGDERRRRRTRESINEAAETDGYNRDGSNDNEAEEKRSLEAVEVDLVAESRSSMEAEKEDESTPISSSDKEL